MPSFRFIPTNVGNTPRRTRLPAICTVHPHERGEYKSIPPEFRDRNGSSPRTWGIRQHGCRLHGRKRFIPTNVGNTYFDRSRRRRFSVHPHERGEYFRLSACNAACSGSSPRTWGILDSGHGNRRWSSVHPHERGEYDVGIKVSDINIGSSPRTWGIPLINFCAFPGWRFIPTNVGNTA